MEEKFLRDKLEDCRTILLGVRLQRVGEAESCVWLGSSLGVAGNLKGGVVQALCQSKKFDPCSGKVDLPMLYAS